MILANGPAASAEESSTTKTESKLQAGFAEKSRGISFNHLKTRSPLARWKFQKKRWQKTRLNRETSLNREEMPAKNPSPAQVPPAVIRHIPNDADVENDADIEPVQLLPPELLLAQDSPDTQRERRFVQPAERPDDLKKITEILPFFDYTPKETIATDDSCLYLCPRPDGKPCLLPEGQAAQECPTEVALSDQPHEDRAYPESLFSWEASNLYHNPLYFEDFALERYGHSHHHLVQPFVSVGRFWKQLVGLPYQMTIDPICKHQYALGWYRPGECAPYKHYQVPWNGRAAAVEAGVLTGLFFLIP